jgi:hypothetical protein
MAQGRVYLFLGALLHLWVEYHRKHEGLDRGRSLRKGIRIQLSSKIMEQTVSIPAQITAMEP